MWEKISLTRLINSGGCPRSNSADGPARPTLLIIDSTTDASPFCFDFFPSCRSYLIYIMNKF